jgi:hypothetical protein
MVVDEIVSLHLNILRELEESRFSNVIPMVPPAHKRAVADGTSKSHVVDLNGNVTGFLILSNIVNPNLVTRSVSKAHECRAALGEKLGSVILEPIVHGESSGRSFALWPLKRTVSDFRLVRYFQRRFIRNAILSWLESATAETLRMPLDVSILEENYIEPLVLIESETRLSRELRGAAAMALKQFSVGHIPPINVLQHSDLWMGNILLPLGKNDLRRHINGIYLIDWAGASISGHPFFDLMKICRSSGASKHRTHQEIRKHCQVIGCSMGDARSYLVAALGFLGLNREHFPLDRYIALCEADFKTLNVALNL